MLFSWPLSRPSTAAIPNEVSSLSRLKYRIWSNPPLQASRTIPESIPLSSQTARKFTTSRSASVTSVRTPHLFLFEKLSNCVWFGNYYCARCATSRDAFSMLGEPIRTGDRRNLHQSAPYSSGDDDVNTRNTPDSKDFPRGSTTLCISDLRENAERRARQNESPAPRTSATRQGRNPPERSEADKLILKNCADCTAEFYGSEIQIKCEKCLKKKRASSRR